MSIQSIIEDWKKNTLEELSHYPEAHSGDTKQIVKLIDLGFLTVNTQYGRVNSGPKPLDFDLYIQCGIDVADLRESGEIVSERLDQQDTAETKALYKKRGGKFGKQTAVLHTERAYVCGYMTKPDAFLLWSLLNLTDKVCLLSEDLGIPVTYTATETQQKHAQKYALSNWKKWGVIDRMSKQFLKPFTFVISSSPEYTGSLEKKIGKKLAAEYTFVQCFDPVHGREADKHLFPSVFECLKKIKSMK